MSLYTRLRKIVKPLLKFFFNSRAYDIPQALPEGPLVICANHISLLDPLFLAVYLERPITFVAKKGLFRVPIVRGILKKCGVIPLSRDGGDAAMLRLAVRELKGGCALCIFPQGKRCRVPCEETSAKGGIGLLVSLSGANVIPAGIFARNYKVRPFRRTAIVFGEAKRYEMPRRESRQEEIRALSDEIFADISALSLKAREIALGKEKR